MVATMMQMQNRKDEIQKLEDVSTKPFIDVSKAEPTPLVEVLLQKCHNLKSKPSENWNCFNNYRTMSRLSKDESVNATSKQK